ncbi:MAG: tRNA (adenosine(37)-N6)-dimethylallyltransferase MiaA [Defluviitaleaceae bacterium]|nr:tRNA (adenosine(37)-N6)-dimethylallyltransferase MiaA [Defluviitaleaceae bacterium]
MERIVIIGGMTACGKSAVAVELAKMLDGEVVSADSAQIYRGMDIGTAKVTAAEMQGVPHHLIDELMPDKAYNVAVFKAMAQERIKEIAKRGRVPIICGGTGFYINALVYNADFDGGQADLELRAMLEKEDSDGLFERLKIIDPKAAESIPKNNTKRIIRALEYHATTGQRISEHNEQQKARQPAYDARIFVLFSERATMYERINRRVDEMLENGLVAEVSGLLERYDPALTSMQAIGYKEIAQHLQGNCTLQEAIDAIKQGTRRFAKRQVTWFRHQLPQADWIDVDIQENVAKSILDML